MSGTHTYAVLEISQAAFDEIAAKFREAGYDHAFHDDEGVIDMHDVAISPAPKAVCNWRQQDQDGDHWSACAYNEFTIIDGTPSENHMAHCCFCGKEIVEHLWEDEDAEP